MKKYLASFLLVLLFISGFSFAADDGSQLSNEAMTHLIQSALDGNQRLMEKHADVKKYFEGVLPLWKDFLQKLLEQNSVAGDWETLFGKNEVLCRKTDEAIKPLKPPTEFKDFHEALTKGLEALTDWSLGMKGRIHYAKTDYQKNAYMKKIEGFRKEWYDSFFGPAVDELTGAWSTFMEEHWADGLTPEQAKSVTMNRPANTYLSGLHKVTTSHLRSMMDIANKERGSKDDTDENQKFIESLEKEVKDFQKTRSSIEKLKPPDVFKEFQRLQLAWLASVTDGTQQLHDIEVAQQSGVAQEKIQAMINKKNQIDQTSNQLHESMDKAYNQALTTLTQK